MASKNNPSPSKNPISSWFKSLKKSDSQTEQASSKNKIDAKIPTNYDSNSFDTTEPAQVNNEDKIDVEKEISQKTNVLHAPVPTKSRTRKNSHSLSINILSPQKSPSVTPIQHHILSSSPTPSRPFLGFKSRSSHSFRPLSQFLDSSSSSHINEQGNRLSASFDSNEKLRTHRDSFLQQKHLDSIGDSTIFGCDIEASTKNAYGTIYISADIEQGLNNCNDDMKDNAYGKVPLVIVACGSFLKSKGLTVEGIFRLAGSNKRVKQLQIIFSSPPDYGAKINWDGYTVHDAASLLRRYLSSLVEPLIPLNFYDSFRDILIAKPELLQHLKNSDAKSPIAVDHDLKKPDKATKKIIHSQRRQMLHEYANLFQILPPIQKRVLFYLLDLLAMFSMKSEFNRMPAKNLAAIFQPSILSHPSHDMNPEEYAVNSLVIESMITYSHKILINIQNEKREQNQPDFDNIKDQTLVVDHTTEDNSSRSCITNQETDLKSELVLNESTVKANTSSSSKGSPLKHMITPLEKRSDVLELNGFIDIPDSSFADRHKNPLRPHSKSVSLAPHSEVLRVATDSVVSVDSKLNKSDERLSTSLSNETGTSLKSLSNSILTQEIKKPKIPESLNLVEKKHQTDLDIIKYQNAPDTPTMDTILKQQITPTHSNELMIQNNDIVDKHDEFEKKDENESFHDCKSSDIATNHAESITSSSFSFQPSLLQGHISRQQSELSINQVSNNKIGREISEQHTEATAISKDFIKDFDGVKFTHPDVITDTSGQLGSCSSSSDEIEFVPKIRSDSSATGGKRTSALFSLPHKIGMNINKSESSSENSSPTTPTKEKRNWFDKLKPRSNTKH
ncbi:hypothetical protein CANINC_003745 [Pichia inconspicua]|uniref:Rho-GAP domain-containing protein n=1 Tax=Pichia inconspicua TaxID=52247 RepID=A0A4V4NFC5_9ASCO|nr:hypothetical protein CANINC_003745 [[Candida] inconspicua]